MNSKKKDLPIGVQSFKRLIEEDFIYVDKTSCIHDLISKSLYYFLSRPRRFGKTLLCSTLEELFSGNQKLFTSLAISATDYSWKKYPVIHISFAKFACTSAMVLRAELEQTLKDIARKYGVEIDEDMPALGMGLRSLILALATINRVVVIIDECDAVIVKNIDNVAEAKACSKVLNEFYSALKDSEVDECLRFVFFTGTTNFSKTSLFGGLNILQDLTLNSRTAFLLGYTEDEIRIHFKEYLEAISQNTGMSVEEILEKMRFWYNGYQFVDPAAMADPRVYNPHSVMLYLKNQIFDNYWVETGIPTFLMELLKKQGYFVASIDGIEIHQSDTKSYDIDSIEPIPLLLQTGYLTIKSYEPATRNYTLTFPNEEVRRSFFEQVK